MKKVLLTSLILGSSIATFAQAPYVGVDSPGGAYDSFNSATEYSSTGADPELGIYFWKDTNSVTIPYFKEVALVEKSLNDGVLKSDKVRTGNGEIAFKVSQPHGLFIPQVGVTFGKGKSLDLTGASSLYLKIGFKMNLASLAATKSGIKIKLALKDANDIGIDAKGKLGGASNQYLDEIYVTVDKTGLFKVSLDLKNTITLDKDSEPGTTFVIVNFNDVGTDIGYEAVYPTLTETQYLNQKCVKEISGSNPLIKGASAPKLGFDAKKVKGVAITFLQDYTIGGDDCYFKNALTDLEFALTEIKLGGPTVGILDEFVADNNQEVSVYDMMGALVSKGKLSELNLESGKLYIVKSGNKSRKIIMN